MQSPLWGPSPLCGYITLKVLVRRMPSTCPFSPWKLRWVGVTGPLASSILTFLFSPPLFHHRMSMRSPASPQLELNGIGNMVNCTIKTEEKNESCYKSTQQDAASTTAGSDKPGGSPRPLSDVAEPQTLPQVSQCLLDSILTPCLEVGHVPCVHKLWGSVSGICN